MSELIQLRKKVVELERRQHVIREAFTIWMHSEGIGADAIFAGILGATIGSYEYKEEKINE